MDTVQLVGKDQDGNGDGDGDEKGGANVSSCTGLING